MSGNDEESARRLIELLRSTGLTVDSSAWMRHPPSLHAEPTVKPPAKPRQTYLEKLAEKRREKEERLSLSSKASVSKKHSLPNPTDPYVLPPGHSALCIPHEGVQDPKALAEDLQGRVRAEVHDVLWVHVSKSHVFVTAQTPKPLRILAKAHEMLH